MQLFYFLAAIKIDGVKVKGYTAWSLMDNFEWAEGYTERFGLHWVNFSDPNRPRYQKDSAKYYKSLVDANKFIREASEPWEYFWSRYVTKDEYKNGPRGIGSRQKRRKEGRMNQKKRLCAYYIWKERCSEK